MSEASAAQWYFDPPDQAHEHIWGPVEHARMTGNPHRKCHDCSFITLDLDDEDSLEEEPYDLEDYMMRERGLIE